MAGAMGRLLLLLPLLIGLPGVHSASGEEIVSPQPIGPQGGSPALDHPVGREWDPDTGQGLSYWGPIPPRADSTKAVFHPSPRPLWATTLLVPYRIVGFPFNLLTQSVKTGVIYLDESGTIHRISTLLRPREGPFGVTVGFKAGTLSGIGGGITAVHDSFFSRGNQFKLRWHTTSRKSHKVSVGIRFRRFSSGPIEVGGGYHVRPGARYFGLGYASADSSESHYTQETVWAGMALTRKIGRRLATQAMVLFSSVGTRAPSYGDADDLSMAEISPAPPFGYRDRSAGFSFNLSLIRDTSEEDGRPESGSIQRLKVSHFWDEGDYGYSEMAGWPADPAVGFWSLRAEHEQFLPLWWNKRALAVRAYTSWLEPDHGTLIPFQRLLTNDEPDLLRGFDDMRWRDRGLAAVSVEYRWPLWNNTTIEGVGLDLYLFSDVGQVFDEYAEVSSGRLAKSYGFGVRLLQPVGFRGRLELAWCEEDTQIRLQTEQLFQYQKGGLFHGRDQIALR